ncbi:hypothetical protein PMAC_001705 [Pneumocystis sp. 'macacae']|nr:hypothetical protein PMAC_001705 [Pneumocystis sp. 'macacae']
MNNQKLKIKAPKNLEKQALEYEWNISWNFFSQAIKEICRNNTSMLSFEELYRNVYNSILHKQGDKLYNGVKSIIQEHLENISNFDMQPAYKKIKTLNQINITNIHTIEIGTCYLQTLKNIWDKYILCTNMISHIMKYMDKVYIKQANKLKIYDICVILFRDYVIKYEKIPFGNYAIMIILDQIRFERQGNKINNSQIKSCVNIFTSLPDKANENKTVFESDLEVYILLETREFYIKESKRLLGLLDASQYLIHCEKCLEEEYNRTKNYFPLETGSKIKRIVEEEMVLNNMSAIMKIESSGLFFMLDNEKFEDLNRLYKLFISVDLNLLELRKSILTKIIELGETINSKTNNMILLQKEKNPINKKNPITTYALIWVNDILQLKDKYNRILKFAFQNDKNIQNTINDAFSKNINNNPKSIEFISIFINEKLKKKHKKENNTNIILDKAIILFKYIKDKDIFEEYYKTYLAKRLLNSYSISNDIEKYMITKLKFEIGYRFTTKLEGMFKDIQLSKDIALDYTNILKLNSEKTSFKLNVAILTSIFWPITIESNNSVCIYPQQIEDVKKSFESFYFSRYNGRQLLWQGNMGNSDLKILLKSNVYEINVSTYSMIILLLFNNIPKNDFLSYNDIQIATNHKTLDHITLIEETTKNLSRYFIPNSLAITKRIESLIEREYIQRHNESYTTYNYLA